MTKINTTGVSRRNFLAAGTATAGLSALSITIPGSAFAQSYPRRPITLVVMYAAGGGTDAIMRKLADEMARAKGWTINVINKPGAVGGVATQFVDAARPDGYTLMGAANYNRFVRVLGHADFVPWEDWVPMKAANAPASWSVRKDSPFQSMQDVIAAAKADPGSLTISTSGTGGVWHEVALILAKMAGIELKYVPYKGGKPATLAGLQGETDIAGGGLHEHIDLIRTGEMRNLCHAGAKDITLPNGTVLPSIGGIIPESQKILPVGATYNFMMQRSLPPEIQQELADAFRAAASSEGFREMMEAKFFDLDLLVGEAADRQGALMETITVDIFNNNKDAIGAEVKSAAELGLPAPEDFDTWWPPQGYTPPSFT
ncbi:Tripartite tricarboxylate transporter family receptor [Thalassovita gelatinovora]|uniref:Tripartite tricarboxylate transporter family receptor n=1 Tax=Thalassovita gelatinovora TaxID=53501 RepID=A0A0P1FJ89_THAGE|nr:tripartite tricarboxylate transporter substrate binding protein [Thalassovita gelatinovora]QIZ81612.1 tripartite tricarboxylate transporter substrate binding protein [Thalassovita gelatinovora]CUH68067.1 Tripartite tricarboxylate transporter family receptor [Thalassovita gelatinovora]SEQ28601.1 Tripartite-type tricarboxylate transporter, receptor component TctC [Thalassovita gelatinovora]